MEINLNDVQTIDNIRKHKKVYAIKRLKFKILIIALFYSLHYLYICL